MNYKKLQCFKNTIFSRVFYILLSPYSNGNIKILNNFTNLFAAKYKLMRLFNAR